MKRILYIAAFATIFTSCTNGDGDKDAAKNKGLDQSAEMLVQFKPVINGVWVKKNYLKKVLKTKSPVEANDRVNGITTFAIDTEKIKGDSLIVPISYANHKGSKVTLKFQPGRNTTTIMLGNDELSYTIKRNDTTLVIYHYDSQKKETTSDKYIKAFNKQPNEDIAYAMTYMINQGMISGTYQGTDAAGKKFNMVFTDDGKVSGYPGLSTYFIQNDFAGPMKTLDLIIFNRNTNQQQSYTFDIKKKTITLHETKANADSTELVADKLKMTLVKIRK